MSNISSYLLVGTHKLQRQLNRYYCVDLNGGIAKFSVCPKRPSMVLNRLFKSSKASMVWCVDFSAT
jgi:hypothetical protein